MAYFEKKKANFKNNSFECLRLYPYFRKMIPNKSARLSASRCSPARARCTSRGWRSPWRFRQPSSRPSAPSRRRSRIQFVATLWFRKIFVMQLAQPFAQLSHNFVLKNSNKMLPNIQSYLSLFVSYFIIRNFDYWIQAN